MTVNFCPEEPDEDDDEPCGCARPPQRHTRDLCDCGGWGNFAEPAGTSAGDEPGDDVTVDFAFDGDDLQLACIYTSGLWWRGIPELYLRPPANHTSADALAGARLAVFLATGLIHLGSSLLEAEGFDVPAHHADLDGQQVQFWLGRQEPPSGRLARNLDPDVDTVIQVHCSLWHAPIFGDG